MSHCRNCGSLELQDLGFIGVLAPFFLKRVFNAELAIRKSTDRRKRAIQRFTRAAQRILQRIQPPAVAVELQSCIACSFVQTKVPFHDEDISRLYADYRSETYNRERNHYEPTYGTIANQVGEHTENGLRRVDALTVWLNTKATLSGGAILDYGGADGKFLPDLPCQKFVYEISDIRPAPGVTRIAEETALQSYSYVQLSHVLEHVTQPLQMARHVASLVQPGGYLLIEVPQDSSTEILQKLQSGWTDYSITIHEHINQYSVLAVQKLLEATGLEVIALDAIPVDTPLAKQSFIRGLAQRRTA
jgi:hypothetical protein